jgi:hypothetical protein
VAAIDRAAAEQIVSTFLSRIAAVQDLDQRRASVEHAIRRPRPFADDALEVPKRAEVAQALGVPDLWLEAAMGETYTNPTVSLDLLHEWRKWHEQVLTKAEPR